MEMRLLKICLLLFFIASPFFVNAQITLGVKGGYTMAWEYYNTDLPDNAEITVNGVNAAAKVYYRLGEHFSLGMEPGYVRRGAACVPGWGPIFEGDTKYYLHYIESPLMFRATIPVLKDKIEIFGKAGYGPAYLLTAYAEETITGREDPEPRQKIGLRGWSILNRWDHGAYGGLGFGILCGPGRITLESNVFMGFRDAESFNTSKNRSLNFSLGYGIAL